MNILFLGDICGNSGCTAIKKFLPNIINLKEISNLKKAIRPKHNFNELENEIIVNLFLNS